MTEENYAVSGKYGLLTKLKNTGGKSILDVKYPTIHGLRGTGILARRASGYEVDQISNDIGMSRQMVEHYMRFKDQMAVGADGQTRLKVVRGIDRER